jgi:uncharacterized protein (DUF1919 family)
MAISRLHELLPTTPIGKNKWNNRRRRRNWKNRTIDMMMGLIA